MPRLRTVRFWLTSLLLVAFARSAWFAASYYLQSAPRFRLESAVILFVVIGMALATSQKVGPAEKDADTRYPSLWPGLLCAAVAVLLYLPSLSVGMLSDDYSLLAMSQSSTLGVGAGWYFRPLPLLIWRLLSLLSDNPVLLHMVNVALHALNAYLVVELASLLGMSGLGIFSAGLIFATFPAAAEAVVWLSGVQDLLLTSLALASVIAALTGRTTLAICCFALGLATKETAICIPVLVLIQARSLEALRQRSSLWIGFGSLLVVYVVARIALGTPTGYFVPPTSYMLKEILVLSFGTLAAPFRTHASWSALVTVEIVLAMAAVACVRWSRTSSNFHRALRAAIWVFAAVGPVYSMFFVGDDLQGSRYVYLAACGWAILWVTFTTETAGILRRPTLVSTALTGVLLVISVHAIIGELRVWRAAGTVRDTVLQEAHIAMRGSSCETFEFVGVPDQIEGAYVFRNGLWEALFKNAPPISRPAADCRLTWTDHRFSLSR
jgi:hypothetical protein